MNADSILTNVHEMTGTLTFWGKRSDGLLDMTLGI